MTTREVDRHEAIADLLRTRMPAYAMQHLDPEGPDWDWLADCPMMSSGEHALVTLAAHLWPMPHVAADDPRSFFALLGAVDGTTRVEVLAVLSIAVRSIA